MSHGLHQCIKNDQPFSLRGLLKSDRCVATAVVLCPKVGRYCDPLVMSATGTWCCLDVTVTASQPFTEHVKGMAGIISIPEEHIVSWGNTMNANCMQQPMAYCTVLGRDAPLWSSRVLTYCVASASLLHLFCYYSRSPLLLPLTGEAPLKPWWTNTMGRLVTHTQRFLCGFSMFVPKLTPQLSPVLYKVIKGKRKSFSKKYARVTWNDHGLFLSFKAGAYLIEKKTNLNLQNGLLIKVKKISLKELMELSGAIYFFIYLLIIFHCCRHRDSSSFSFPIFHFLPYYYNSIVF